MSGKVSLKPFVIGNDDVLYKMDMVEDILEISPAHAKLQAESTRINFENIQIQARNNDLTLGLFLIVVAGIPLTISTQIILSKRKKQIIQKDNIINSKNTRSSMSRKKIIVDIVTITILTYVVIAAIVVIGILQFELSYFENDINGDFVDIRNWISMVVTLVIPGALALILWRYSDYKNKESTKMIKDVQNLTREIKQEKQNRKFFALSRLRINVKQIIHYLQEIETRWNDQTSTDSQILGCLHNAKAQIRDIENISKIASSDLDPALTNTLRKRCDFLELYSSTYQIGKHERPSKSELLPGFEKSLKEISSNFSNVENND